MKKYLTAFLIGCIVTSNVFCQETKPPKQPLTQQDYLKKSKEQRIGGFILLGAGIAAIALVSNGNSDFGTTGVVAVLGGASILGSIPLFIAAGRNKRKSKTATVYLNIEKKSPGYVAANGAAYLPSLTLKIKL